jgi:hypothetical protein
MWSLKTGMIVLAKASSNFTDRRQFLLLIGVRLSPLGTAANTGLWYQPQMIDDGDCGIIGGMKIGRGN